MSKQGMESGTPWDDLAKLPFSEDHPTAESATRLYEELLFQQAVQVYLLALPAVNMLSMRDGSEAAFGGGYNVLPIWKDRMDAKCKVTTPNADVIYAMSYLDLKKEGPLVICAPPKMVGMLTDFWQRALTDVGLSGPDQGEGGLYLLLPPDYQGHVPQGYFTFRSPTYNVFLFWRGLLTAGPNGPQTRAAVESMERTRIFPLYSREVERKPMQFPNGSGVEVNMLFPRDRTYFEKLPKFVDDEPVEMMDGELRGLMASIGIEKSRSFQPDARRKEILERAAQVAPKMIATLALTDAAFPNRPYYEDRQWWNPYGGVDDRFWAKTYTDVNTRTVFFFWAYSSAPAMVAPQVGTGAKYLSAVRDADGDLLSGGMFYQLHVPPEVSAALYWGITIYNVADGTMVANGQRFPSLNSLDQLQKNADGSYDISFGPEPPQEKEVNWLRTLPGHGYMVCFRLYGPTVSFFDQTWKPGDLEKVK